MPPAEAVRGAAVPVPDSEGRVFIHDLENRLRQDKYVEVLDVDEQCRYGATAAIAAALGGLTGAQSGPLGGELTEIVTSTTFDHNLAWHTDSTSWERPNRWQVLTLIRPDELRRPAPTSILPWSTVLCAVSAESARTLGATTFGWRDQFPALTPLSAPILGQFPRWLRPALGRHLEAGGESRCEPLVELSEAIGAATNFVDAELTTTSILVFDNHAVLHRGPHLDPDGGRAVLRLKLGGVVGDLGLGPRRER